MSCYVVEVGRILSLPQPPTCWVGVHPHTCVEVPQLPWVYSLESLEFLAGQSTGRAASEWNSSRQV